MCSKKVLPLVFLFMLFVSSCNANDRYFYLDNIDDTRAYFDKKTINLLDDGSIDIWLKFEEKNKNSPIAFSLQRLQIRPNERKCKTLVYLFYDSNGDLIDKDNGDTEWSDIAPETYIEKWLERLKVYSVVYSEHGVFNMRKEK